VGHLKEGRRLTLHHQTASNQKTGPKSAAFFDGNGDEGFTITGSKGVEVNRVLGRDAYSTANAFVDGRIDVEGDLCAAIRFFLQKEPPLLRQMWYSLAAGLTRIENSIRNGRHRTASNIRFHYDRSTAFYRQFLDSRMVYSEGHFTDPSCSLEEAQLEKLDRICRWLNLRPSERFLDVGCGWGALVIYAAQRYGAVATGCTLSRDQFAYAQSLVKNYGLERRVKIQEVDYRDLEGRFDKIASVGMFEHVGPKNLAAYFRKIYSLLEDGGLFLNRGVVRPQTVSVGPETLFLQRSVFPGGELVHLADMVREGERAGFEVLEIEDVRLDYALTCRAWVSRLLENRENCRRLVGDRTYRTWLLYLAASAVSFEDAETGAVQVVLGKLPPR